MKIKPYKPKKKIFVEKKTAPDGDVSTERVNRTVYITVAVLLIVLAAAVAMTSAANRAKRGALDESGTAGEGAGTRVPSVTGTPAETKKPSDPAGAETGNSEEEVAKVVPTMLLPADGSLGNIHDPTIQVFSDTLDEWRVHLGVDILTAANAEVRAAADGTVQSVGADPLMGTCISVKHNGGAVTVYKNLSETLADGIEAGAKVRAGQLLGTVGDSAILELAEEPHLHFEMSVAGEPVDPLNYFSTESLRALEASADVGYEDK